MTWQRRTLHDFAAELRQASEMFRRAYLTPPSAHGRANELKASSIAGVEVLRALALAVRSEQDSGLLPNGALPVGAFKTPISNEEVEALKLNYRPPFNTLPGFSTLSLREGLNKISHADARTAGFAVDRQNHDLLLQGINRGMNWLAVLSIPALCTSILALPDWTLSSRG